MKHLFALFFVILLVPIFSYSFNALAGEPDSAMDLQMAIFLADAPQLKALLAKGANPNATVTDRPMLGWAAQSGNVEIVKILIDAKADLNAKDGIAQTALMRAADTGQLEVLKVLIAAKPDVNARTDKGVTALLMAIQNQGQDIVQELINAGADPNAVTAEGDFATLAAAQEGNLSIIAMLGKAHANFNLSNDAYTPLSYAVEQSNKELVKALLAAGADPNFKTKSGSIPLIRALDDAELLALLLAAKADPQLTNSYNDSAFSTAIRAGSVEQVEALIKGGADVNGADARGSTPLMLAQSGGTEDVAAILRKNGAH